MTKYILHYNGTNGLSAEGFNTLEETNQTMLNELIIAQGDTVLHGTKNTCFKFVPSVGASLVTPDVSHSWTIEIQETPDDKNPFRIPDLTPMLEAVTAWVLLHQGKKGFILTDDHDCDTIWCYVFNYKTNYAEEKEVKAVRVKQGRLQIHFNDFHTTYSEEDVKKEKDDHWYNVHDDETVYFVPTIFNLAENIIEYGENAAF